MSNHRTYTMRDYRRARRKRALVFLEWKVARKYTWRQRRYVRQRYDKYVKAPLDVAIFLATEERTQTG